VNADNHDLPAWAVDDDPELAELLARPLEVPEASGSDGQERALVGPVPAPAPSSLALVELEAASVEAVGVLRWALHHGESTRNRIAAARAILGFNLGVWQTAGKVVDPLGDLMRSLIPAAGNGTHG
jgi:hypothetical protein